MHPASMLMAGISFGLAIILTRWLIKRFSQQLLDLPNDRSSHTQPTPRGGGVGFLVSFIMTALTAQVGHVFFPAMFEALTPNPLHLTAVLAPLAIVGGIDDYRGVSAKVRYAVQLGAAAIAIFSFGLLPQPWFSLTPLFVTILVSITLIGFTALINFYNFMDGLDGLVASVTAFQLAFLAVYLQQPTWWLLVAALLGFLWWNWSPAKIFMGDVGSTVLGASVAISLIAPTTDPVRSLAALAITLPLTADAIYTLIRRLLRGENIFQAHCTHLYQRLQQLGWSHRQVAILYLIWSGIIAALLGRFHFVGSVIALLLSGLLIGVGEIYLQRQQLSSGID